MRTPPWICDPESLGKAKKACWWLVMEKSQIWGVGVGPLTWCSLWMSRLVRVQSSNSQSCKDRPSNECLLKMCFLFFLSTRPSVLRERETGKNGIHWPNRISVELFLESQCMFYFGQQCQIEKLLYFLLDLSLKGKILLSLAYLENSSSSITFAVFCVWGLHQRITLT